MKTKLTARQKEVFDFICSQIRTQGFSPTVREIGERFDIKSPNGVVCHLKALEKKGLIKRQQHKSRAITVVENQLNGLQVKGTMTSAGKKQDIETENPRIDFQMLFGMLGEIERYVLQFQGDSMIDSQIRDGDFLVIESRKIAENGEIVVINDGTHERLYHFFQLSSKIMLKPGNNQFPPIYAQEVDIRGVVIGVVRSFNQEN